MKARAPRRRFARLLPLLAAALLAAPFGPPSAAADEEPLPLIIHEDFEAGAHRWQPTDPGAWKLVDGPTGKAYSQHQKSDYKPPHRSPFNMSLLKDVTVGDFILDAHVQSTVQDYNHRDVCLFFGYQDPAHLYYVHLGKKTDDHANQIFIVNAADRTKISLQTTPGTDWDDNWHHVRIVRRTADGSIEVYFDDMDKPVMRAKDSTFTSGQVGVGTFDDTAVWDNVTLRGTLVNSPGR